MVSLFKKMQVFFKSIKVLKNWHVYPLVYLGLIKNKHVILETRSNLKMKLRTNSTDLMAFTSVWLDEEYSKPKFEIETDDVVLDIGAHIGLFTLFASQFCTNGKIYCFEPIKENFELLQENIKMNNLENVIIFNVAVSDQTTPIEIFLNEDFSGHSMYVPSLQPIYVESTTIEKIFNDNHINNFDFVKIDCEGAEYPIIDSIPDSYYKKIKKMIIEYHFLDSKPELLQNLIKKLEKNTFATYKEFLHSGMGFLYALNEK